ncbi:MAG: DUF3040 domain-containing protein [Streptosporangiaceae bacterium]
MALSRRERRVLAAMEKRLAREDPELAGRLTSPGRERPTSSPQHSWARVGQGRPRVWYWILGASITLVTGIGLAVVGSALSVPPVLFAGVAMIASTPLLIVVPSVAAHRPPPQPRVPSQVP